VADNTAGHAAFATKTVSGTQLSTVPRTARSENGETTTIASAVYFELGDKSTPATYSFYIKAVACDLASILAGPFTITVACDASVVVPQDPTISSMHTFPVSSLG